MADHQVFSQICCFILMVLTLQVFQGVDAQAGGESFSVPPFIIQHPNAVKTHVYIQETSITLLTCIATGYPNVRFTWRRNEVEIPAVAIPAAITNNAPRAYYNSEPQRSEDGTFNGSLVIVSSSERVTGMYQCFAALSTATKTRAMSERVYVHEQVFATYNDLELQERQKSVVVGEYLGLPCPTLSMMPTPVIGWNIADEPSKRLIDNRRIVQDDRGTLHILNVVLNGSEFSGVLECGQTNTEMGATARGMLTRLKLEDESFVPTTRPPKISYVTQSPALIIGDDDVNAPASKMQDQIIYCIFSGYPTPNVEWKRANGDQLGPGVIPDGPRLIFRRARASDSGTYICSATNSGQLMLRSGPSLQYSQQITVNVYTKPRFQQVAFSTLVNKTVGEDVRLDCSASGTPTPAYQWFINSVPEKESELRTNGQMKISYDQSDAVMGIFSLKKQDSSVITCNASNGAGYLMRTIVLNVLNKTTVKIDGPAVVYANRSDEVRLRCTAQADASLPLEVYWKRQGFPVRIESMFERGVHLFMADGGRTANLVLTLSRMNESDQLYWAFGNTFECVAQTTLAGDRDTAFVTVKVPELSSLSAIDGGPAAIQEANTVVQAAGFEVWMIGLVIAFIVLVAIIIGVVFVIRRQKGGSYLVDAKERAQGNDPLKELKREGFADYVRPDQDPTKSSRATLDDVENAVNVGSDDEDSMGEYGQVDTAKFDEDGSFIDQYGSAKKGKKGKKSKKGPSSAIPLQVQTGGQSYAPLGTASPPSYFTSTTPNGTIPLRNGTMPPRIGNSSATPTTSSTLLRGQPMTPSGDFTTYPNFDIDKSPLLVTLASQGNGTVSHTLPSKPSAGAMQSRATPPAVPQRNSSKSGYNALNRLESTSSSVATLTTPNGAVTPASFMQHSPNANLGSANASVPQDSASGSRVSVNNRASLV